MREAKNEQPTAPPGSVRPRRSGQCGADGRLVGGKSGRPDGGSNPLHTRQSADRVLSCCSRGLRVRVSSSDSGQCVCVGREARSSPGFTTPCSDRPESGSVSGDVVLVQILHVQRDIVTLASLVESLMTRFISRSRRMILSRRLMSNATVSPGWPIRG